MFFGKIVLLVACTTFILCSRDVEVKTEEDLGVKYASRCEVCKVLATELQSRLEETGKVHDVIEIGYSLDDVQPKKKTKYQKSELRLIESLDGVCERILEYNIHKERQDSTRFAKGMSQTFKTLHGLVDKGVKVDLGIPYELWDKPSAEITHLKTQCESLLEDNEEAIEHWYWNLQGSKDLIIHLCNDHALRDSDKSCLFEELSLKGDLGEIDKSKNRKKVKDESVESDSKVEKKQDSEDNFNGEDEVDEKQKPKKMASAENKRLRNILKYIEKGRSNKPNQIKSENNDKQVEQGESYWTEPTEYVKKQLEEEEILKKLNEPEANVLNSEEVWLPGDEFKSEREEL